MSKVMLSVKNLKKHYYIDKGWLAPKETVKAVDDISFDVYKGETFGIVGESGCGKSTAGKSILKLHDITSGKVTIGDVDISLLSKRKLRELRSKMQMVFQDPYASLNPKKTVRQILLEPLKVHGTFNRKERTELVLKTLQTVGLSEYHIDRYPHEFSGGQRQRIGIAKAVILNPDLIIADEPVSALDVSIQSQVINLMLKLQKELELTYVFISHDLGIVRHISDRVAIMYLGKIVELAETESLFETPKHPYTEALLSATPINHPREKKDRIILRGDVPSPANPPTGCAFHPRCPYAMDICKNETPQLKEVGDGHSAACHLF